MFMVLIYIPPLYIHLQRGASKRDDCWFINLMNAISQKYHT